MTDALHGRPAAAAERPLYRVRRVLHPREVESLLADDRGYAAYALGHLEPDLFPRCAFWRSDGPAGGALVLHANAVMGRTLFVSGAPAAVEAVLSLHPGPLNSYLSTCAPAHLPMLERRYALSGQLPMMRMTVEAAGFVPAAVSAVNQPVARELQGSDAGALNSLYATDGGPAGYRAADVERAVYYGVFAGRRLVAAAGTHMVSPHVGVAVVGNVMTHPAHRGRGLGTRVTGAVTAALLERGVALVALTVDPANEPAVRAYTRLGYRPGAAVVEARARRRDWTGLGSMLRRWAAQRRGATRRVAGGASEQYAYGRPPAGSDPANNKNGERGGTRNDDG